MKIILVSPYSEHLVGGIINWTKYIINYHREHDGDVDLQLLNNENAVQVMGATGPIKRLVNGLGNYIPVCRQFKKKIAEEHIDVAHICTSASFGLIRDLLIVNAARKKGVKTIVHMHFGRIPQILKTKGWERSLFLKLIRRIDCAIVMDRASFESLHDAGFKNVCFLPNPLSEDVRKIIEKQGVLKREARKIVFAGHVVASKGVFELVEACREIEDVKLELLGKLTTDDVKDKLLAMAGENASEWLNISGNMPFEEVIKAMMSCAVFVLPSYSEGFPNVILEAMACGCPIVSTPVGAMPEMLNVDGVKPCGVCVPVRNSEALREAISKILDNPTEADRLGENARIRVDEMYAIPKVWEQLLGIWKSL